MQYHLQMVKFIPSFITILYFSRYLYHGNSNPELAFESAKILCCISCNSNIQIKLVGDFTHDQVNASFFGLEREIRGKVLVLLLKGIGFWIKYIKTVFCFLSTHL